MLTKEEIDALIAKHSVYGHATLVDCKDLILDAIAAHQAKALEGVEPVCILHEGTKLYDDTTVAALLAEIERLKDALQECRNMVGHPDNVAFIDAATKGQP